MRSTVFGLDVLSEQPLLLLQEASTTATGRSVVLRVHDGRPGRTEWPDGAERISDEYQPDGSEIYRIESHPEAGFLISGSDFGAHLLSIDGRELTCWRGGVADATWQRLLIAQVLPFAALLQGLEVFHASAVVHKGRALALLGPSGVGKTSLALELCCRGADFLADDVVALEPYAGSLLAHPGTQIAGIARAGPESAIAEADLIAVNTRERLVRVAGASGPAQLGALFFLDRREDGPAEPHFESSADPQMLLASTFNFVLASPERLRGLLEVCALAAARPVERISIGPQTTVSDLARAIEERLSSFR